MGISITRFLRDELATTAIEYALIAGTISIAMLAAVDRIGTQLNTTFSNVWAAIKQRQTPAAMSGFLARLLCARATL